MVSLAAVLAITVSAGRAPAVMLHDPALLPLSARALTSEPCGLSRVGTLFVRCDNLTGNAVRAPKCAAYRGSVPHHRVSPHASAREARWAARAADARRTEP